MFPTSCAGMAQRSRRVRSDGARRTAPSAAVKGAVRCCGPRTIRGQRLIGGDPADGVDEGLSRGCQGGGQLGAGVDAELAVGTGEVDFEGAFADEQRLRDVVVGAAGGPMRATRSSLAVRAAGPVVRVRLGRPPLASSSSRARCTRAAASHCSRRAASASHNRAASPMSRPAVRATDLGDDPGNRGFTLSSHPPALCPGYRPTLRSDLSFRCCHTCSTPARLRLPLPEDQRSPAWRQVHGHSHRDLGRHLDRRGHRRHHRHHGARRADDDRRVPSHRDRLSPTDRRRPRTGVGYYRWGSTA